ncbi:MAG: hypothetical protein NVSMB29_18780 [Candidatus Dormibacteria bacterium]
MAARPHNEDVVPPSDPAVSPTPPRASPPGPAGPGANGSLADLAINLVLRPRLRGVLHQWTFVVSLLAGGLLIARAGSGNARAAVSVYAASLALCLGVSALYHRVPWSVANKRRMQKVDHAAIFVLIAGTFTPIAVIVLSPLLAMVTLLTVWGGAALGIVMAVFWSDPPVLIEVGTYLLLGTLGLLLMPALLHSLGVAGVGLIATGGLLYWCGAMVYARRRPDPWPRTFGFHEIFHVFVVLAAGTHFAVIALVATR